MTALGIEGPATTCDVRRAAGAQLTEGRGRCDSDVSTYYPWPRRALWRADPVF